MHAYWYSLFPPETVGRSRTDVLCSLHRCLTVRPLSQEEATTSLPTQTETVGVRLAMTLQPSRQFSFTFLPEINPLLLLGCGVVGKRCLSKRLVVNPQGLSIRRGKSNSSPLPFPPIINQ